MGKLNLHRLRCFVVVVEEGSVSKAAKKLNMSQPPLSMLIRKLEDELNVTLFERYKKRLLVTETGNLLYERAKGLLSSTENILKEITEHNEGIKGIVRIGTSTSANITIIPRLMEEIKKRSLDITLDIREGKYTDILREIRSNEMDLGLVRNAYQPEELEIVHLMKEPLLLALPVGHHLLKKKNIELYDLRDENFLMQRTTQGQNISDFIMEACHSSGFSPKIIYWGTTSLPILLMVKKGAGVSFVPQSFLQLHDDMNLPPLVKVTSHLLSSHQSMIMLKNRYRTEATKQIIEIIKQIAAETKEL